MDRKKIKIYGGNGEYFIEDQYQKNNNVKILFLIVNRLFFIMKMLTFIMILMLIENYYLKSGNKYFIRYKHPNKTDIVPLQLKLKNFY